MKNPIKTVYITKFVETEGVFALEVEIDPKNPQRVINPRQAKSFNKPDWFEHHHEALEDGRRRLNKIALETQARARRIAARLQEIDGTL